MTIHALLDYLNALLWSGWTGLLDYLAAHVLLCLVPAFVIAGFMSAMIPKETITRYLGPRAPRWISYPAAAVGGFILAVCSCTILPLFAGIWKRGAGLGVAITFLFVGPAINILAIAYTGAAIGMDIALARVFLSILFGIGIGMIMAWAFRAEEARRAVEMADSGLFDQKAAIKPAVWQAFLLLVAVLIVGTLQVPLLTGTWFSLHLPVEPPSALVASLSGFNLTPHGALLILMLLILAPVAYLGLENVLERFNRWTYASLALVAFTLLLAAPTVGEGSLLIGITGRFIGEVVLLGAIGVVAARGFEQHELAAWLWETWRFVKQIFPLLVLGVFLAGVVKVIIPETWIQTLAGRNTL
ncbi:MAG TPA: permease, partial [Anaerolineales bacterium]|nr:permease [Anaerolineales bacterium]